MPASRLYSLNDELVSELVAHMRHREWRAFASTCRRLCRLVRTRYVCALNFVDLSEAPLLLRVPSNRAFSGITRLQLEASIATLQDQAALCKAVWLLAEALQQLENVQLIVKLDDSADETDARWAATSRMRKWMSLDGPLLALQGLPSLKYLSLQEEPDERSLLYFLPGLTQLTGLDFSATPFRDEHPDIDPRRVPDPGPPLRSLPNLVDLSLQGMQPGGERAALPCGLTSLVVDCPKGVLEAWWQQIAECEHLQELLVCVQNWEAEGNPSLLLKCISNKLTALTSLRIHGEGEYGGALWEPDNPLLPDPTAQLQWVLQEVEGQPAAADAGAAAADGQQQQQQQQQQEELLPQLPRIPLGKEQGWGQPALLVVVPPPNMGALSCLVRLEVETWWLVVSTERHWRALAGCSALQKLRGLHTCVPPPAGVSFPGVTRLDVIAGTTPGDTGTLLGAFPALKKLQLVLVPQEEDSSSDHSGSSSKAVHPTSQGALVLPHVAKARIAVEKGPGDQQLAPYFTRLFAVLPGLQQLSLG